MPTNHAQLSKGAQKILQLIKEASAEGGVMRWQGLRRLGIEPAGQKLYIPLGNDGTLLQQFKGLEKWSRAFAKDFGFKNKEASLIALAYVARQLRHENHLLNNQTAETKQGDSENLGCIRDSQWGFGKQSAAEQSAKDMFHLVACVLTTPDHRQGLSTESLKKIEQAEGLLAKANAAFYVETGVSAMVWARTHAKEWAKLVASRKKDRKNITQEATRTAELLASNAYGNNANKIDQRTLETLLLPLTDDEKIVISLPDNYIYSRNLAAATAQEPSRGKTARPASAMPA
ncbi:MAG: hypothetical protein ABTQ34_03320 [Bdellovibrionales bacterium]